MAAEWVWKARGAMLEWARQAWLGACQHVERAKLYAAGAGAQRAVAGFVFSSLLYHQ
jgi:hypothetical protein